MWDFWSGISFPETNARCITVEWKQLHLMHLILTDTCLKVMSTLDSCIPCQSLHRQAVGCWLWWASNVTQLCNNWRRGLRFTALERRSRSCRGHPWHQATCHFPRLFLGLYWPRSELNVIRASYHDDAHRKSRQNNMHMKHAYEDDFAITRHSSQFEGASHPYFTMKLA